MLLRPVAPKLPDNLNDISLANAIFIIHFKEKFWSEFNETTLLPIAFKIYDWLLSNFTSIIGIDIDIDKSRHEWVNPHAAGD